jgi:hypothetical protein
VNTDMSTAERAPHCPHKFTVAHIRGNDETAHKIADDLRSESGFYVSELYMSENGWAVALCQNCAG